MLIMKKALFLVVSLFAFQAYGISKKEQVFYNEIVTLSPIIQNGTREASGFFITNDLLVTSYQVVEESFTGKHLPNYMIPSNAVGGIAVYENIPVQVFAALGGSLGRVLVIDPKNDLALIKMPKNRYDFFPLSSNSRMREIKNEIVMIPSFDPRIPSPDGGYGNGFVLGGMIKTQIGNELFHAEVGFSSRPTIGSPVLSPNLEVIGMVTTKSLEAKHSPTDINPDRVMSDIFAIPFNKLRDLVERHRDFLRAEGVHLLDQIRYEPSEKAPLDFYIRTSADRYYLGLAYKEGVGSVVKNEKKSLELFMLAARQGYAEAQFEVGSAYYYGLYGVKQNFQEAFYWFEWAAYQKHVKAQYQVSYMIRNGEGISKDVTASSKWRARAFLQEERFPNSCEY